MTTTVDDIKTLYPLPAWYYQVHLENEDYAFSEVSGLSKTYETITYKDGVNPPKYMPGMIGPVEFSLKRGVVKGGAALMAWLETVKLNTVEKKTITISLLDENHENPVVTWTVKNAFPKKIDAPSFNATSNEVAIESLDLMADDLEITYAA